MENYSYRLASGRIEQNMVGDGIGQDRIFKDHLVQLPDLFKANQKLKHAIESTVQMPLSTDRDGTSAGKLFQYLKTLMVKKFFLMFSVSLC